MISKTAAIKQKILHDITTGKITPGESTPSRHQYMRKFGCARATIDTVINSLVKDGYLLSKRGGGTYVRSKLAENVVTRLIILDSKDSYGIAEAHLHSARIASACSFELSVEIFSIADCYARLESLSRRENAVVWIRPNFNCSLCMDYLSDMGVPQLLIGRCYGDFDYVTTDAKNGIRNGLSELAKHTNKLAFVSERNNSNKPYVAERKIAFYQSAVELGINLDGKLIFDLDESEFSNEISRIGSKLLDNMSSTAPLGVLITNFTFALPLLTYAEANGKKCGRDFRILLFDVENRLLKTPGVSMLAQQWDGMAERIPEWLEFKTKYPIQKYAVNFEPELLL